MTEIEDQVFTFPKNFLWGAATSSHQIEGGNTNNDWWEWERSKKVKEPSGQACDHWNRFREDFGLAKSLGHNAHRFSIEWSRVEPEEGRFSEEVLTHYQEVVESLKTHGLEPVVTLHHFTLPLWLAKQGGWLSERAPMLFGRYTEKVVEALGRNVRTWVTLNEPVVQVTKGYLTGEWPPGERSYKLASRAAVNLLKAHVLAYEAIKKVSPRVGVERVQVGIAKHVLALTPCSPRSWKDRASVRIRNVVFNYLFVRALIRGRALLPGLFYVRLSKARVLDFIGLNYYTRDFVHNEGFRIPNIFGEICTLKHHRDVGKRNFLGWEIYPEGLYQFIKEFSRYRLPLLVTENGICTDNDAERWEFIKQHLVMLAKAIKEGARVIGYLHWSLLDNFEWAEGFAPRFGLVEVDYATQERKVRPSALKFAEVCASKRMENNQ